MRAIKICRLLDIKISLVDDYSHRPHLEPNADMLATYCGPKVGTMRKPKNRGFRKRSSGRTDAERDVELFLPNERVYQIADYASRVRIYERLTDGERAEHWIHAFS